MDTDVSGMAQEICNTANDILAVAQNNGLEATLLEGFLIRSRQMSFFLEKQRFKDAVDIAMLLVLEIDHHVDQENHETDKD